MLTQRHQRVFTAIWHRLLASYDSKNGLGLEIVALKGGLNLIVIMEEMMCLNGRFSVN